MTSRVWGGVQDSIVSCSWGLWQWLSSLQLVRTTYSVKVGWLWLFVLLMIPKIGPSLRGSRTSFMVFVADNLRLYLPHFNFASLCDQHTPVTPLNFTSNEVDDHHELLKQFIFQTRCAIIYNSIPHVVDGSSDSVDHCQVPACTKSTETMRGSWS